MIRPIHRRWLQLLAHAICVATGLSYTLAAQNRPDSRFPVDARQVALEVAGEMRALGLAGEFVPQPADIELPLAVPARAAHTLRVAQLCWDANPHRVRARIECREAGACLPFLAYARTAAVPPLPNCRASAPHAAKSAGERPPIAVRPGERATAVFEAAGLRMSAPVTCLERGAMGETVHVRGPGGIVFRARITSPARLEALPGNSSTSLDARRTP